MVFFRATLSMLLLGSALATGAAAQTLPRLEPWDCPFTPPEGERATCHRLVVAENRDRPDGATVNLPVAILKARGEATLADSTIYLAGGPGESPLVPDEADADPLVEGDWWSTTEALRRRRDLVIVGQRGAELSLPELGCEGLWSARDFRRKTSPREEARAREAAAMRDCRADLERRGIDPSQYRTPALADDVADLARVLGVARINLYGISYGTRWGLEIMRRHPALVRAAVLDSVYPPHVRADEVEPLTALTVFERLFADCAADTWCGTEYPDLRARLERLVARLDARPRMLRLDLADGRRRARVDGAKALYVVLSMLAAGGEDVGYAPTLIARAEAGDFGPLRSYAEKIEERQGGLIDIRRDDVDGLYNSIECRETSLPTDQAARSRALAAAGPLGAVARLNAGAELCPLWRVAPAPPQERLPAVSRVPTLLLSSPFDWLTPTGWAEEQRGHLAVSRHVVFRAAGHSVTSKDACAMEMVAAFIENPDPARLPACESADEPPAFSADEP